MFSNSIFSFLLFLGLMGERDILQFALGWRIMKSDLAKLFYTSKFQPTYRDSFQLLRRAAAFGPKGDFGGQTDERTDNGFEGVRWYLF